MPWRPVSGRRTPDGCADTIRTQRGQRPYTFVEDHFGATRRAGASELCKCLLGYRFGLRACVRARKLTPTSP